MFSNVPIRHDLEKCTSLELYTLLSGKLKACIAIQDHDQGSSYGRFTLHSESCISQGPQDPQDPLRHLTRSFPIMVLGAVELVPAARPEALQ